MEEGFRARRVAELIRLELTRIIQDEIRHPHVHDVVITEIKVTKDMGIARVYVTSYDAKNRKAMLDGLSRSVGFIRHHLVRSLQMKKVPHVEFYLDETPQYASRIDSLLNEIKKDS